MAHQHFAPLERGLPVVRPIVEYVGERVIRCAALAPIRQPLKHE